MHDPLSPGASLTPPRHGFSHRLRRWGLRWSLLFGLLHGLLGGLLGGLVGIPALLGCAENPAFTPTGPTAAGASAAQAPVTSATRAEGRRVDIRRMAVARDEEAAEASATQAGTAPATRITDAGTAEPARSAGVPGAPRGPPVRVVHGVEVHGLDGQVKVRGTVDLGPSIDRILAGRSHRHRNDGAIFENREGRLPRRSLGHYREYVHPTPQVRGAGPQRIVVGGDGAWYYTPDHYRTFRPLQESVP